jgi:hypothetical protein
MISDPHIREMIQKGSSFTELYRGAVQGGMRSMMKTALERVHHGQTTLQEVERVLGGVHEDLVSSVHIATDEEPAYVRDPSLFAGNYAEKLAGSS